uniref:transposase n=1 Tax=Petrimonas mucosa TaxID=1642646 RepID=UPI001E39C736|nr:transposase [Petrimonas mucosa]
MKQRITIGGGPERDMLIFTHSCNTLIADGIRQVSNLRNLNYFTYLQFHPRIQSMVYTTNWIERLNKDFRRVLKMRGAMPNEESVLVLIGKVAMDKDAYNRELPGIDRDKTLFPGE